MHFNFDPAVQDVWVQDERFPATPAMVGAGRMPLQQAGCTIVGLTGRNDNQREATLGNLAKVGYTGVHRGRLLHEVDGCRASSQQPAYITCAAAKCTTIEYKSQTRRHVESAAVAATTSSPTSVTSSAT